MFYVSIGPGHKPNRCRAIGYYVGQAKTTMPEALSMEDILINCTPRENRVAVIVDDILEDVHIERSQSRWLVGNVYKGKVIRVLPGMQSAFIDIGLERTGFLHVMDIESAHGPDGVMKPIEKILCEGVCLMVQVAKDPIGTQGARLEPAH